MTSRTVKQLRVVTLNCRDDGWLAKLGRKDVDSLITAVDALGTPPHILCLPRTTGMGLENSANLLALTRALNELLPMSDDKDCFYPVWGEGPRSPHSFGLWLRIPRVRTTTEPHELHHLDAVSVSVAGVPVRVKPVCWRRERAPWRAQEQAEMQSQLSTAPTLLLGDFAASFERDQQLAVDWWESDSTANALKWLLKQGFWDAGLAHADLKAEEDPDAARIFDHILVSDATPARIYSYFRGQPNTFYPGVACTLEFDTPRRRRRARHSRLEKVPLKDD